MSAAAEVFMVRLMEPGDLAFVTDSWLRSAWHAEDRKLKRAHANRAERQRAGKSWFQAVRPHVEGLIRASNVQVIVACDRTDRAHIAGWMAVRDGEVIRSHVKLAYRPWAVDALLMSALDELNSVIPLEIAP
jgi:hypothetical protein